MLNNDFDIKEEQQELANKLGVKKSSIQKYEKGKVQNLKLVTIQNLCRIFQEAPIAFVFPEKWAENSGLVESGFAYYHFLEIFSKLSEEGKEKIFTYAEDIKEINRYAKVTPVECKIHLTVPKEKRGAEV